jgi:hypothetical protein
MLPDLFKVDEGIFEALANGGHAAKSSALELLALEQRLSAEEVSNNATTQILSTHPYFNKRT